MSLVESEPLVNIRATEQEIMKVNEEITVVNQDIAAVEEKLVLASNVTEIEYLRKKEEQLRKKEEQLRKKEEQLRKKEEQLRENTLILLRNPGQTWLCVLSVSPSGFPCPPSPSSSLTLPISNLAMPPSFPLFYSFSQMLLDLLPYNHLDQKDKKLVCFTARYMYVC